MNEDRPEPVENPNGQEKLIDIEKVISNKNPRLLRLMPGFLLRYLKRILHQDALNDFIRRNRDKQGLEFVDQVVKEYIQEITFQGIQNVPADSRIIVAANHPLGGLDGIALMHVVGSVRSDIIFPVNDLLMNIQNIRCLFIPVNKHGSNAQNLKIIHNTFASGMAVLYFPAGLVSRKQKGGIRDLEWKKTFISYSRKFQRDVIPTYIDGNNSDFFYNLARFRKRIGIKQNIEMLYLVDEMEKQKNKTIRMTFGCAIPWQTFDKRHSDSEWAALLRNHVYRLKSDPGAVFNSNI